MNFRAYFAWFSTALFFFYQYILRVSPGVMVTDLRSEFYLTAEQFSSLGAIYLCAYSLLQIPLGILIDRVGVRRIVLGSMLLCIFGTVLFGLSWNLLAIQVARFLIGVGSACAFMASLKIATDYFPQGKRGLLIGATLALGTIGALTAGNPLVWLIGIFGWRNTAMITAALGVLVFLSIFVLLSLPITDKQSQEKFNFVALKSAIWSTLRNRKVMIYATLAIGLYAPLSVLADLWGTAFLIQKYGLSRSDAAKTTMMMYVGLAIGSLILPWACEKWNMADRTIQICTFVVLCVFGWILLGQQIEISNLAVLFTILGIFCGAEMVCFTGAVQQTTLKDSGLTIGIVNTLNMLSGAVLQKTIGVALDMQWSGQYAAGIRVYHTAEFEIALTILLVVIAGCFFVSLCKLSSFRRKKC